MHKFGIELTLTGEEAYHKYEESGTEYWMKDIDNERKELHVLSKLKE